MNKDNPSTEASNQELETVVKNDSGPEHTAPKNPDYSSDFDEFAGREDTLLR